SRRGREEVRDERRGIEDVLEVVEHQEHRSRSYECRKAVSVGAPGLGQMQRERDGRGHIRRVRNAVECDEPDAVGKRVGTASGDLDGEARLADATGPRERDEPRSVEQLADAIDISLTANEGGEAG